MNDILDREILVNDLVFVLQAYNSSMYLELAVVAGFTATLLKLHSPNNRPKKKSPHNTMKASLEDAMLWIHKNYSEERIQEYMAIDYMVSHAEKVQETRDQYFEILEGRE